MKVTLLTPPYDLFRSGYGTKRPIKRGHLPSLGLGYIASSLEKYGHEVQIIDASAMGLTIEDVCQRLSQDIPDVVGITSMTATVVEALKLAKAIGDKIDTLIVLGGPHATCFPKQVMREESAIDIVVVNEGEQTMVELLERIGSGKPLSDVKGICFRYGDEIISTGSRILEKDLDVIPMPARHLFNNELYSPLPYSYKKLPSTTAITSRGCPFGKCAFCYSAGRMGQKFRRHSPDYVIEELKILMNKYGMKEVVFCDDDFMINKKWVSEFCDKLIKENLNLSWTCAARAPSVTKENLKLAAEAGCWTIFYGLESGVQELLDIIKKGITLEKSRQAIEWTHDAGIETRGSFMVALPGETPSMAQQTINFAIELDLTYAQFTATYPDPGTELYDIAKNMGKVELYEGMNRATYVPEGYRDRGEVEAVVRQAYRQFYLRPKYFLKHLKKIRSMEDIKRYYDGFKFLSGLF